MGAVDEFVAGPYQAGAAERQRRLGVEPDVHDGAQAVLAGERPQLRLERHTERGRRQPIAFGQIVFRRAVLSARRRRSNPSKRSARNGDCALCPQKRTFGRRRPRPPSAANGA
jgi:hypothetical protein